MRNQTFWFPTWSDTNQAVQSQKMVRGENNMRLCLCIYIKAMFRMVRLICHLGKNGRRYSNHEDSKHLQHVLSSLYRIKGSPILKALT